MAFFDPNQPFVAGGQSPGTPWDEQQATVAQQRKMADMLRKQGIASRQPEAQMVGGQYIAPHILERMVPLLQQGMGSYYDQQAGKAEQELAGRVGQAKQSWQSALPQAVAAVQDQPQTIGGYGAENVVQGPDLAPAKPLTREAVLKHTLAGMQIPGNEREAALVNQSLTADIQRGEDKTFRDEQARAAAQERKDNLTAQLEARREALARELENKALDRASREQYQKMHDETLRQLGAMRGDSASREAARDLARLSREQRDDVEKISRRAEPIVPMINTGQQVQDMLEKYKDPKTGKFKSIPGVGMVVGSLPPGMLSDEGSSNRQKIQMFANAVTRAQAGLSQTLSEQEKVDLELMRTGAFRQDQFLRSWPGILEKVNSTTKAIEAGYEPEVLKVFNARGGGLVPVGNVPKKTPTSGPVTPAMGDLSPAEQARLEYLRSQRGK